MRIVLRHQAAPAAFSRLTERNLAALPVRASPCQDCLRVPAQGPVQRFRLGCDFSATVEVFRPLPAHLALLECARPSLRPRSFRVRRTFSQGRDLKCFGKKKPRALPGPCVAGLGLGLVFRDHGRGPGTEPVVHANPQSTRAPSRRDWHNRVFKSFDDIVDHCCYAWNTLIDQPWKIMSVARRDWATVGYSM